MKRSSRVVLNRAAIDGVTLAIADGVFEVVKAIVEEAHPPDETPYGVGLVKAGGALTYVGPKKVNGFGLDGRQPAKPRAVKVAGTQGIVGVAGYGFPARFQELGTVHQPARPFLWPAVGRVVPRIPGIMRQAAAYRLARIRSLRNA